MILGLDYGPQNIGLATSEGEIAQPYGVVHKLSEIETVCQKLAIDKIVVGVSEGKSKEAAENFGAKLQSVLRLPVEFIDETLSSHEAGPKNHAKAAAIILQRYLDDHA